MKFPAYPKYKNSGVQWLGDVPVHWDLKKVRYISRFRGGSTPLTGEASYWDGGEIPWVTPKDMKRGRIRDTQDHLTPEGLCECASSLLSVGHVLIVVRSGILRHSLPVAVNDVPVALNQDMRAFKLSSEMDSEYLRWFIEGNQKTLLDQWCKSGTTVESIEMEYLSGSMLSLPPPDEQNAIAAFLDRETGRIDALVDKKRALLERLKEKRAALISRTVTQGLPAEAANEFGLQPHTQFKPSGIEWLGEIPEGWGMKTIKYVSASMISGPFGSSLTKDKYSEEGYRVYGQEQVIAGDFTIGDYYIPAEYFSEMARYKVSKGDVLVSCVGTFGKVVVVPDGIEPGIINPRLVLIRPDRKQILSDYMAIFIRSLFAYKQLQATSRGGTMDIINLTLLKNLIIPLPSLKWQKAIVEYLDRETAKLDRLSEKVGEAIERLLEYRAALITAAVTGRIDVRGEG